jgi:hypothetical protein
MLVVVGTSPFHDTSVAVGPFRSEDIAANAAEVMTERGWNVEVCELVSLMDVDSVVNLEGEEPSSLLDR